MITISKSDVNANLAYQAHSGTSWSPEKRRDSAVKGYVDYMQSIIDRFTQYETETNTDNLTSDLERFKAGYIQRLHSYWSARSRVVSSFIAGPSNFPVRQMQKRNATVDRRYEEMKVFCDKVLKRINRDYNSVAIANAPISSDEPDAIQQLQTKIDKAQAWQNFMKAANRIARSKKLGDDAKVAKLIALSVDGCNQQFKEKTARELLVPKYGKVGFASYELTNNNANIRRMKQRIESLRTENEQRETLPGEYEINGFRVVENHDDNRLQIFFGGDPGVEMRKRLKSRGFRWARTWDGKPWQRQLNNNARYAARQVLENDN